MIKLISILVITALAATALAQAPRRAGRGSSFLFSRGPRRASTRADVSPECVGITVRTLTGFCTNDGDPTLGEAGRAQSSYLNVDNAEPEDTGLPSARLVSNTVSAQEGPTTNSQGLNELFTFFGQFVDHDFALSPFAEPRERFDIEVPADDPELSVPYLEFFRSERERVDESSSAVRPITAITSALDLSNVYGSDEERNQFLRVPNSCLLKTSGNNLLPRNTGGYVNVPTTTDEFFIAGDVRANETPMLTAMHTIWVREHNRLCGVLDGAFPDADPAQQYETARAINIAEYQKIIYEEWLPAILGPLNLRPYEGYRRAVDPTISVEFTTAGFRLGHTLVGENVQRVTDSGRFLDPIPAEDMFFLKSDRITNREIERVIRGASAFPAQEFDEKVVDTLRNFLFENVEEEEGFDLVALNLQRSRDHNVPKYNDLREFLRGNRATTFNDISGNAETRAKLTEAYGTVDNVEAWIGLVSERKPAGAGVGRTLGRLLREEFGRLRNGDQFFYERRNTISPQVFQQLSTLEAELFIDDFLFNRILLRTTSISAQNLRRRRNAFLISSR
ncbi:Myeloperoxidase [Gracilariopsis chorda]|uniref:Myeloperoxidase n=1 Tax=Gracilariopsis chorda TaxID=448386 RepID=A0A2V3IN92_9FLOR|nr:Myeloperoxidase [Gracilariopsis chorda]|eukprot:PXF43542.1 Myeloperoxidase [Gracilariopsis chorda]